MDWRIGVDTEYVDWDFVSVLMEIVSMDVRFTDTIDGGARIGDSAFFGKSTRFTAAC